MDYPTPEEEYELMYGEELEMMEDFNGKSNQFLTSSNI
jgi:hypothetical protein